MDLKNDLKVASQQLYDQKDPLNALHKYDDILSRHPQSLQAIINKSTCLDKLYYSMADWHNPETIQSARDLLDKALQISISTQTDNISLVYFRKFIHYFNAREYLEAGKNMELCEKFGYKDDTLPLWQAQLEKKLSKLKRKKKATPAPTPKNTSQTGSKTPKFLRKEWYQAGKTICISLFVTELSAIPLETLHHTLTDDTKLSLTAPNFKYEILLSNPVESDDIRISIFSKKIEILLSKKDPHVNWKALEPEEDTPSKVNTSVYPTSSKKEIDWSKLKLDDEDEAEEGGSADAFFQKIYADADPDTRRAMMKSFVESNGTTLNTNWDEVSKSKVEPAPPKDMELKHW